MRKIQASVLGLMLALSFASCSKKVVSTNTSLLPTKADSVAYAFGLANGDGFRRSLSSVPGDSLSRTQILAGFGAALKQQGAYMSVEEARKIFQDYVKFIQEQEAIKRIAQNDSVFSVNKNKPGVHTTSSGLQYRELRAATGVKPQLKDTVEVHYKGMLLDGTTFDSSYDRRMPATFALNQVIPGWTEGLQLMSVGSKYEFYIPSSLAYGEKGAGNVIPANSALIFEVELLDVKPYQEEVDAEKKSIDLPKQNKTVTPVKVSKKKRKNNN